MSLLSLAGTVTRTRALAWGAAACVALAAGALAWGVNLGRGWERGARAQLDVRALQAQIAAFADALDTAARDQLAAQQSLAAITRSTADDLAEKRRAADAAARSLDRALAARPDLDSVRVGADILRFWNASNAADDTGAAAGAADSNPAGERQPDGGVPGAADSAGRQSGDAAAQSHRNGGAIPPVRWIAGGPERGSARARADRGCAYCARHTIVAGGGLNRG